MLNRRLAALLLLLTLPASNVLCAGSASTPASRMACCADPSTCPMNDPDSHHAAGGGAVSQAQADDCCALSSGDHSTPLSTPVVFPFAVSVAFGPEPIGIAPVRPPLDFVRTQLHIPPTGVRRHLLLSVFLI